MREAGTGRRDRRAKLRLPRWLLGHLAAGLWVAAAAWGQEIEPPIQEVFQSELVYPQEQGELQLTLAPRWQRAAEAERFQSRIGLEEHFRVVATASPYEALRRLRASPFEILLADLMMDELPGLDLIRAARNTRPALQAIVMTGYASKAAAVAALKEGVYDFLEKPLTPEVVRQTVARAWRSLRGEGGR